MTDTPELLRLSDAARSTPDPLLPKQGPMPLSKKKPGNAGLW